MGRILRYIITFLFGVVLLGICLAVVSEFFIKWAEELGWYDNPIKQVDSALSAIDNFVNIEWVKITFTFFGGLTLGLWIDTLLRKREIREAEVFKSIQAPTTAEIDGSDKTLAGFVEAAQRVYALLNSSKQFSDYESEIMHYINIIQNTDHSRLLNVNYSEMRQDFLNNARKQIERRKKFSRTIKNRDEFELMGELHRIIRNFELGLI